MSDIFFKVREILLNAGVEENEARAESNIIITTVSGQTLEEIYSGYDIKNYDEIFAAAHKRAKTGLPVQYVLSSAKFMGFNFKVDENVLIPRDETELLIRKTVETANLIQNNVNILDIGTGSGIISCMCAKLLPNSTVMGVDISTDALKIAIENMEKLNLVGKVVFRKSDIFSSLRASDKFDIIVSNPPYIPLCLKNTLQNEVEKFEPHIALFAPDDNGIYFYEKIIKNAKNHLKEKGYVLFEAGINQALLIKELFVKHGYKNIETFKDMADIERVVKAEV